jgi:response regulator of citrate/malate metabolism
MAIRVLVVEDEEIAAAAHATYLSRLTGFEVAGVARSGVDALRMLGDREVDLVLLDFNLPDGHGLQLLQRIRAAGHLCDVVAVTSARDLDMVQRAVAQGVVLYLLKPFTFAGFRAKLEQYAAYRSRLDETEPQLVQDEVDQLIGLLRPTGDAEALPKGMSAETLRTVTDHLRAAATSTRPAQSASEVAAAVGTSRVTARRYLEHLADAGLVARSPRYGGGGRPEVEYRWQRG